MPQDTDCVCKRCNYRWRPRVSKPGYCPQCTSPAWDKEPRNGNYRRSADIGSQASQTQLAQNTNDEEIPL